jgi:hypothetical protein
MDVLSLAGIRLQCFQCGGSYLVPLRDILLSHQIMHEGCPVAAETECPPVFQSRLASHWAVNALDEAWRRLEHCAQTDGGELVLMGPSEPLGEGGKKRQLKIRRYTGSGTKRRVERHRR